MSAKFTRQDDFAARREHLKNMTDDELKAYFWRLAEQTVDPLLDLAKTHTSPSIERSVLLRMGFSSLEAKAIVDQVLKAGLISKGAGHVVYVYSTAHQIPIREAGLALAKGIGLDQMKQRFGVKS